MGLWGFAVHLVQAKYRLMNTEKNIDEAIAFLKGGSVKAVKEMETKMLECSENLQFEEAAKLRDRIKAIKNLEEKQKVVSINVPEEDVFALVNGKKKSLL